jgi:hypothetical protein
MRTGNACTTMYPRVQGRAKANTLARTDAHSLGTFSLSYSFRLGFLCAFSARKLLLGGSICLASNSSSRQSAHKTRQVKWLVQYHSSRRAGRLQFSHFMATSLGSC